ncbi:unnamed protein product [Rangifer tarandus platyrhynchus]|uniref:Uncharacterized protein n=1 Tax=Rangifer tarandus platyrhynchus TaxID=3082113 RepID=A0ABN8YYF6_RANTA|nr:unnamed protein product [Rangifer tarandus platyrhynchus]
MITAVGPRCFRARKPRADEESDRADHRPSPPRHRLLTFRRGVQLRLLLAGSISPGYSPVLPVLLTAVLSSRGPVRRADPSGEAWPPGLSLWATAAADH